MAEQINYAEWLCLDGYDLSGVSSNFGTERTAEEEKFTCFPDPTVTAPTDIYVKRLFGVESAQINNTGYLDRTINLPAVEAALAGTPVVSKGNGRSLGDSVLMFSGQQGTFGYGGEVGKVIPFTTAVLSKGAVVEGSLFEFGNKTATGNGTSRTMPAVTSGKSLYIHVHVTAISGTSSPTLTLIYERSAIGDYSDAVTVHTFTAMTAIGAQRAIKTSVISDLNHRFRWTISGTNPIFQVRLAAGVR